MTRHEDAGALAAVALGKQPVDMVFDWQSKNSVPDPRAAVDPDPQRPLVYSLFGTLGSKPSSPLILSQDDYFEYLAGAVRNRQLIPPAVRMALTDSALLFVGFKVSDWDFRVLLQSIRDRGGSSLLGAYKHIAVQIDPDEGSMEDLEMVRRAIEKMGKFEEAQITVFWGSVKEFMSELRKRLPQHYRVTRPQTVGAYA